MRPTPQPDLVSGAMESAATPLKKWTKRWSRKRAPHNVRPRGFLALPRGLAMGNNRNRSHGNRSFVCGSKQICCCLFDDVFIGQHQNTHYLVWQMRLMCTCLLRNRKHSENTKQTHMLKKENRLFVIESPYCGMKVCGWPVELFIINPHAGDDCLVSLQAGGWFQSMDMDEWPGRLDLLHTLFMNYGILLAWKLWSVVFMAFFGNSRVSLEKMTPLIVWVLFLSFKPLYNWQKQMLRPHQILKVSIGTSP